ncbi:MAG: xanthan lyase [Fuerstiella sp.]
MFRSLPFRKPLPLVVSALIVLVMSVPLTGGADQNLNAPTVRDSSAVATDTSGPRPHPDAVANIHPPGEVDKPELVPFVVPDPQTLDGLVVDETEAVLVGTWQYSTHTPPWVGLGYLHDQKTNKGKSSVTFTPDLPQAGLYEVRLSHCYNVRRSINTPVTIHHADGQKTMRINQQQVPKHGRLFRSLGTFRFEAGQKGWVRISNDGTDGKYVIADAVQFIRQPDTRRQSDGT